MKEFIAFILFISVLALSGCNLVPMPASAESLTETRVTVAELANVTAPNTYVAKKAASQAKQNTSIMQDDNMLTGLLNTPFGGGGIIGLLSTGLMIYQKSKSKKRETLLAELEPEHAKRVRESI